MNSNAILTDIVDDAPSAWLKINYPSGVTVGLGEELTPTQVKDQPEVIWEAENDALYTLLMVDPDAPSRANPIHREVAHWLVINIPGGNIANGQTVVEYIGSVPAEGSGLHRNIFLLFKQTEKIESTKFISKTTREGRLGVRTREYIKKFKLGIPIAGNYFQSQYDEYVDVVMEKLSK